MIRICTIFFTLTSTLTFAQSELSFSFPVIYSTVKVKDNWTPPTAPFYKEYLEGSAIGYGILINYSFRPGLLIRNKNFRLTLGTGYFGQTFNLTRPFNYDTFLLIGLVTENYTYHCLQVSPGLAYRHALNNRYTLSGHLSYNWLYSFKQTYTPAAERFATQTNRSQFGFASLGLLSIGVERMIGERVAIGASIMVPLYTKWRNDEIFDDDPTTFFQPEFSLGGSLHVVYHID